MNQAILGSSANVLYFDSATLNYTATPGAESEASSVISGVVIAESPALYAFMLATEYMEVPAEKIQIVSIGSKTFQNDKISNNVNPLQWFSRFA